MKDDTIDLINHDDFNHLTTDNLKLSKKELKIAKCKIGTENQLLFAVMLKYHQIKLKFPDNNDGLVLFIAQYLSKSLGMPFDLYSDFDDRTARRFKNEIREMLGFREATGVVA